MRRQRNNNKYHAVKVGKSASKKEARRKWVLEAMEAEGIIQDLRCQVPFTLIPAQREPDTKGPRGGVKKGKCIEQSCVYVADFVYKVGGRTVVEDVKGYRDGQAYALYVIKRKLMLWVHGIRIKEV